MQSRACRGVAGFGYSPRAVLFAALFAGTRPENRAAASDASGILDNSRGAAASGADATVYADDDDGDAVMVVSNVMSPSTAAAVALIAAGFNSDMGAQPILRPRPCVARARLPMEVRGSIPPKSENEQAVREAATVCPRSLQVDNIFVYIRQMAGLFRHVGCLRHQHVDL